MNVKGLLSVAALATLALVVTDVADAARLGGGRSIGAQRQSIAPPAAPSSAATAPSGAAAQPVMPAQPGAAMAKPAVPAAAPAASGASRWLGPIAGLAAGLGLAALLSHFGLSEAFGSFLLLALLAIGVVVVARLLFARRMTPQPAVGYAGAGRIETPVSPPAPSWGGGNAAAPTASTVVAGPSYAKPLPAGFDAAGFAAQAKLQFNRIQAAWDTADRAVLADVMTPEMLADVSRDLAERGPHRATEVVTLAAEVLEVATEGGRHWASVRYTGMLREDGAEPAKPIDEVWNLTKPVDGSSGWLLAGIQQLA